MTDLKKLKKDLLFLPLGGANEIGMNLNLYHLDGKWLMVDCGAGFAEDFLPAVDMIVPNIEFIKKHKDKLVGIVLTHAHEDHLGAIQYLWDELECPVYATPFTATFLREKLKDYKLNDNVIIKKVKPGSSFKVDNFEIELVQITHSVPEMNAVVIKTKYGNIFHTGDWKLDPNPLVGPASDIKRLKEYGKEGILALTCDSTNVFSEGRSGSEGDVRENLIKIIKEQKQLVVVTTFASNVARLETIAMAAKESGRKIIIAGRSLWRIIHTAQENGYLKDIPELLTDRSFKSHPREKLLVLSTGCQGEPLAATNKLSSDSHPKINIIKNDTIIFSSKIIPGNEKRLFRMFNRLANKDINVITEKNDFVHVSGHPCKDELKELYDILKPEISIPVHGEPMHIKEHSRLAKSWGVKKTIEVQNGLMVKIAPEIEKISIVENGMLAIDGSCLVAPDSSSMKARRKLFKEGGVVIVSLIFKKDQSLLKAIINAPGLLDLKEDFDLVDELQEVMLEDLEEFMSKSKKISNETIKNTTRAIIKRYFKLELKKQPPIDVNIVKL